MYEECEFGSTQKGGRELLKALILVLDAKLVIEAGSYELETSEALAKVLDETGGKLITFDVRKPSKMIKHPRIEFRLEDAAFGLKKVTAPIDLAFLDSASGEKEGKLFQGGVHTYKQVLKECKVLLEKLAKNGVIVIHNTFLFEASGYNYVEKEYKNIIGFLEERGFQQISFFPNRFNASFSIFKRPLISNEKRTDGRIKN